MCISLSPFFYSRANKGKTKTPAAHSLRESSNPRASDSFISTTAFPHSFRRMHRPKTQAHSCSRNPFPKARVRVPRNYPNNKATIMGACRTASRDFQHAGREAGELDARRLRTVGVFVFPLLACEHRKGEWETYGRRRWICMVIHGRIGGLLVVVPTVTGPLVC